MITKEENDAVIKSNKGSVPKNTSQSFSLITFMQDVFVELQRVVWPSVDELIKYTIVVIATVIILGMFLFVVDYVLQAATIKFVYNSINASPTPLPISTHH